MLVSSVQLFMQRRKWAKWQAGCYSYFYTVSSRDKGIFKRFRLQLKSGFTRAATQSYRDGFSRHIVMIVVYIQANSFAATAYLILLLHSFCRRVSVQVIV